MAHPTRREVVAKRRFGDSPSPPQPRASRRAFIRQAFLAGLLGPVAASGCAWMRCRSVEGRDLGYLSAPAGFSYFVAPLYCDQPPQRVLLLAPECTVQPYGLQTQFIDVLADQLRQAQLFEVVTDHNLDGCACDLDAIRQGRFDERHLLRLTERYHADGLMLARVNQFNSNWPMQTSVTCVLIDRAESIVLFAADGFWDTNEPELAHNYMAYTTDQSHMVPPAFGPIQQQSPKQLQRFVAWQISRVLVEHHSV